MSYPVYNQTFTRNFTLVTAQIWARAETIAPKIWTKDKQPFLPYIVVQGNGALISCYYYFRGIIWLKDLLTRRCNEDSEFIQYLQSEITQHFDAVRKIYTKKSVLTLSELRSFLKDLSRAWVWFEAGWWIWEMTPEDKQKIKITIPREFYALREKTHDVVPKSEAIIRASLKEAFVGFGSLCDFLTFEEIQSGVLPGLNILKNRNRGFFFVDNTLYINVSKQHIERKYKTRKSSFS